MEGEKKKEKMMDYRAKDKKMQLGEKKSKVGCSGEGWSGIKKKEEMMAGHLLWLFGYAIVAVSMV